MLPNATAGLGNGICLKHGLGDLTSILIPKDCPECGQFDTVTEHKRCAECAKQKNKCAICDEPLMVLKIYVFKTSSRSWCDGVYILFAYSLEEARTMFFEKMKQVLNYVELDAAQLFSEWQVDERAFVKGFIYESAGIMMANAAREED